MYYSLNVVWKNFVSKRKIGFKDKLFLVEVVARAIACYGCWVWGCESFEE